MLYYCVINFDQTVPKIAKPAGCVPEMKIIELESTHSSNELYFPSCIRMSRCSGCCPSQRLHCIPINTSFEDITVNLITIFF